jgi:hypothetical protein
MVPRVVEKEGLHYRGTRASNDIRKTSDPLEKKTVMPLMAGMII